LHDAIYSRDSDRGRVREAFLDTFDERGFLLSLKDED
jgi:hypothetical protein